MIRNAAKSCHACNLIFSREDSIGPRSCPHCEKNGIIRKLCGKCYMKTNVDNCFCINTKLDTSVSVNLKDQKCDKDKYLPYETKLIEDDFYIATKVTANNSKGNKRKIGNSKKCSENDLDIQSNKSLKSMLSNATNTTVQQQQQQGLQDLPNSNILNGTRSFFQNQMKGNKKNKSDTTILQTNNDLAISLENYSKFVQYNKINEANIYSSNLICSNLNKPSSWCFNLLFNNNICFYGIGCKRMLVNNFVKQYIYGEDVIEFEGGSSSSIMYQHQQSHHSSSNSTHVDSLGNKSLSGIRILLNHIIKNILKIKEPIIASNLTTQAQTITDLLDIHYERHTSARFIQERDPMSKLDSGSYQEYDGVELIQTKRPIRMTTQNAYRWGGRYAVAQSKLYIIIHDILGDNLNNSISQECLAILASCESVAIIATLENLNSIVQWNRIMLSKFNWIYEHVPTFQHHSIPESFSMICSKTTNNNDLLNEMAYKDKIAGVKAVLSSLTKHHNEMFSILWEEIVKQRQANPNHDQSNGISFEQLLIILKGKLIIKSSKELNSLLKEFIDHKLLTISTHQNNQYISTLLPSSIMDSCLQTY